MPPFLEYANLSEISWMSDTLPELIWVALVMERFDNKLGAKLCADLANAATACSSTAPGAFAFISEYRLLSTGERQCITDQLTRLGVLNEMADALRVLAVYYPECPLSFIWAQQEPATHDEEALHNLKLLIEELTDRRETKATFVQATAVYIYKVFKGSELANFTNIEDYPKTEASVKVAAVVRAAINGFPGSLNLSPDWRNYFWNRGLALEPCEGIGNGRD